MARLEDFNPDAITDDRPSTFDPLPDGVYTAQVIESDLVAAKTGNGQRLALTYEIVEGPFARRRIWDSLNIIHSNAQAQEIAQRDLKRLCAAVGHQGVLSDSEQLHFKPFRLRVGRDREDTSRNVRKDFAPVGGQPVGFSQASQPQQRSQPQTQQQAASGGSRPWAR